MRGKTPNPAVDGVEECSRDLKVGIQSVYRLPRDFDRPAKFPIEHHLSQDKQVRAVAEVHDALEHIRRTIGQHLAAYLCRCSFPIGMDMSMVWEPWTTFFTMRINTKERQCASTPKKDKDCCKFA